MAGGNREIPARAELLIEIESPIATEMPTAKQWPAAIEIAHCHQLPPAGKSV
jgi:hypothetical protein